MRHTMHRFLPLLTASLVALGACVPAETGIDNSRIDGQVRLLPVDVLEVRDRTNDVPAEAVVLDEVSVAAQVVTGALTTSSIDGDGQPDGDVDIYQLTTGTDLEGYSVELDLGEATARVELLDLDRLVGAIVQSPVVLASAEITGAGSLAFPVPEPASTTSTSTTSTSTTSTSTTPGLTVPGMSSQIRYGLRVSGLSGPDDAAYTVVLPPLSPEGTQVLVGAWLEDDVADRATLVAGSVVQDWTGGTAAEGWVWTGSYRMFLARALESETTSGGEEVVTGYDEDLSEVFVFAGTWASLNQGLPAGTWYSATPVSVRLDGDPTSLLATDAVVYDAAAVSLDTFAPIVVGFAVEEEEPNDAEVDYASFTIEPSVSTFNDAGLLSGPGFVDIFRGTLPINAGTGFPFHDSDAWQFAVPEPSLLFLRLDWDSDAADLDVVLFDEAGEYVDFAASSSRPEVGGGYYEFEPDTVYYLVVAGYLGDEGTAPAYELRVEQTAP